MSARVAALLAFLLIGCRREGDPPIRPPLCEIGRSPFVRPNAAHILVADFQAHTQEAFQSAVTVTAELDRSLAGFDSEVLASLPMQVPSGSVEIRRLRCPITSHDTALQVAAGWQADLVIWGTVHVTVQQSVSVRQEVSTGSLHATENGRMTVGQVNIQRMEPYVVRAKATLLRPEAIVRRSLDALNLSSPGQLDLPTLSANSTLHLVELAVGLHFAEAGRPEVAARLFQRAIPELDSLKGPDVAPLQVILGVALFDLPNGTTEATRYLDAALRQLTGSGSLWEFAALNNLGLLAKRQGKYVEALDYYQRAKQTLPPDEKAARGIIVSNIGTILLSQSRNSEAEAAFQEALQAHQACCADRSLTIATDLNNLGLALALQSRNEQALDVLQEARSKLEASDLIEQQGYAVTLSSIGWVLDRIGKHTEARSYQEAALALHRRLLGSDHSATGIDLHNLAKSELALGNADRALGLMQDSAAVLQGSMGPHHLDLAEPLQAMGDALRDKGEYGKAIGYLERALAIKEQSLGKHEHGFASCLTSLGATLYHLKRYEEALRTLQRSLKIEEAEHGPAHVEVGNAHYHVGRVLDSQKKYEQALKHYESAISIFESINHAGKSEYGEAMMDAASIHLHNNKPREAVSLLQRAVGVGDAIAGNDSTEAGKARQRLGYAYERVGEYQRARESHQAALEIYMRKGLVMQTALQTANVGRTLDHQGACTAADTQYEKALALLKELPEQTSQARWLRSNVEHWLKLGRCRGAAEAKRRTP